MQYLSDNWIVLAAIASIAGAWAVNRHRVESHSWRLRALEEDRVSDSHKLTELDVKMDRVQEDVKEIGVDVKRLLKMNGGPR